MAVVDVSSGRVIATVPIGEGPDAVVVDTAKNFIFSSNGQDGTITVIKEESPNEYSVVETSVSEKSARSLALDGKTHTLYLSSAQFGAAPAATGDNPHPRPKVVSGSFHLLIVAPN
jgi:DNA-binding beta-propeller fold protein YncE